MDEIRDPKPYHIVLWGAWYGSHNIGDQLLLLTITALIHSELKNVHFTILTDSPKHIQTYMQAESNCVFEPLASRRQIVRVFRALATADFFIIGGGVPYFQNLKQLGVISFLTGLCKLFKTPYGNWCVSSQPVSSAFAKRVFGWTLNGARFITFRDNHTNQLFEACGVKNQMVKTADSAFTFHPVLEGKNLDQLQLVGKRDLTRPLIALMPRTLIGRENKNQTHYTRQSEKEFQREIECFSAALDWSWENGFQPIFIPMNTFGEDDDRIAAHLSAQKAKYGLNALLIDEEIRPQDARRILFDCRVSFSARVHGSILSAISGCPIMMYAFQPKHEGIMFEMGLQDFVLKPKNASTEATCNLLGTMVNNRDQIRKDMQTTINGLIISARLPLQLLIKHLAKTN